jgi:hypothetical protein
VSNGLACLLIDWFKDIELCIPAEKLSTAISIIDSNNQLFERFPWPKGSINIYTEYKSTYARFKGVAMPEFIFVVFPDTFFHLNPLKHNTIRDHPVGAEYSNQLSDFSSNKDILSSIPFPRLAPLVEGFLRRYHESKSDVFAMCAEQLVDGMDLDENWCKSHLDVKREEEYKMALKLVKEKSQRISPMYPDYVTCYISAPDEAKKVRRIPGRN